MEVSSADMKHSPGSLACMTMDEVRCLATRLRISHWENGQRLKKDKLIQKILGTHSRERYASQALPSLFAAQRQRQVQEPLECAMKLEEVSQAEQLESHRSSTVDLRRVIQRHHKFARRRSREKRTLYKLKLRDRVKTLYQREGRVKAKFK